MTVREFISGLGVTVILTACFLPFLPGVTRFHDAGMGILLASLNGLLAGFINRRTMGREHQAFMIWNMGGRGCRALLLLVAIALSPHYGVGNPVSFAAVTFTGYFSFLAFEIAALNRCGKEPVSGK